MAADLAEGDTRFTTLRVNPVLLCEITSPSTEDYDRGEKLRHYKTLPSLSEVLLVSHREPRVTLHRRDRDTWLTIEARAGQQLVLPALAVTLFIDQLYANLLEDA